MEQVSKYRQIDGVSGLLIRYFLVLFVVWILFYLSNSFIYLRLPFLKEQFLGTCLGFILCIGFLKIQPVKSMERGRLPWYDVLLSLLGLTTGLYSAYFYKDMIFRLGNPTPFDLLFGIIALILILELVRRIYGKILVILCLAFIFYCLWGNLFPGILRTKGMSWERAVGFLYMQPDGIYGTAFTVTCTVVAAYILFGNMWQYSGGGSFFADLAFRLVGKSKGGPAKVSVISSSLFGTISGSAVANVMVDGWFTIPLMKKSGYSSEFAAAVEAAASTGGIIMPPVMGVAAFIMAEFLCVPYGKIAVAAALPAILYYVGLFLQIHLRALKTGLGVIAGESLGAKELLRISPVFVIPILVLIYFLLIRKFNATTAGLYASGALFIASFLSKKTMLNMKRILVALEDTGRVMVDIGSIGATAGIIIGVTVTTGLGFTLPQAIESIAAGNLYIALLLTAGTATIMGMGMPATPVYILLAILAAPSLITMGVNPIAAHLFVFYFGCLSMLTPPVCIAVFAAAGIANSEPMKTGIQAVKLGIVAYLVPFFFVFDPGLLLMGSLGHIALRVFITSVGVVVLAASIEGYIISNLSIPVRLLLGTGGVALMFPGLKSDILGFGLVIIALFWYYINRKRKIGGEI